MDALRPIQGLIDQVQNRLPANILYKYLKDFACDLCSHLRAHDGKLESTRPGGTGDILPMETASWSLDTSSPVPEPQAPIDERQPNPSSQLWRPGQALVARRDPAAPSQPSSTLTSGLPRLSQTGNACSSPPWTLFQDPKAAELCVQKKGLRFCRRVDCGQW
ncbi:unnamed protein product [Miscanthus lutarioriparius]|uniref:Uncharacterized protein n=1 Tax=Miscanthus lutarioriparius TaxID=422564 RepID=A0A811RUA7_9POAL|nr:unnamed protein product [Miscanthus lutarioriparius]